jgi:hypothetical protein
MLLPVRFSRQYALASWPESALVSECSWRRHFQLARWPNAWPFSGTSINAIRTRICCLAAVSTLDRVAIDNTRYARARTGSCSRSRVYVAGFGPSWPRTARAPRRKSRAMSLACMRRIALPASGLRPFPSWQPWRGAVCGPHLQPDKMPRRS